MDWILSKCRRMSHKSILLITICSLWLGCNRHTDEPLKPHLNYAVQDRYLQELPSAFTPLSPHERELDWGKEYTIAMGFAKQLDLYQSITAFKRAQFLIPIDNPERKQEIDYGIILCYYFGGKYQEAIDTFEKSPLRTLPASFKAKHDLLVVIYDCYLNTEQFPKATQTLHYLYQEDAPAAEKAYESTLFKQADLPSLHQFSDARPEDTSLKYFLSQYDAQKKSVGTARSLNAVFPGAGYLYLGQKQSAVTAFLLNSLFIAATVHFFQQKQYAAGAIFASFETGWYFGGIVGAGLEAKYYNERLYEELATPVMTEHRLFPTLMLRYSF